MAKINNFKEGIKRSNQVINDIMFLYKFRVKKMIEELSCDDTKSIYEIYKNEKNENSIRVN